MLSHSEFDGSNNCLKKVVKETGGEIFLTN